MRWTPGDPMTGRQRVAVGALVGLLAGAGSLYVVRQSPREEIAGHSWRQTLRCDFRQSWCPAGWGWGEWARTEGGSVGLVGRAPADSFAVYFFGWPSRANGTGRDRGSAGGALGQSDRLCDHFRHGGDFVMETEVRLLRDAPGRSVEAQLLIREGNAVRDETGVTLVGNRAAAVIRYRTGFVDHIQRSWPLPGRIAYHRWYRITFVARGGHVRVEVDGTMVFDSRTDSLPGPLRARMDGGGANRPGLPAGTFIEPHIAVKNGAAEFRALRLFARPDDRWAWVR